MVSGSGVPAYTSAVFPSAPEDAGTCSTPVASPTQNPTPAIPAQAGGGHHLPPRVRWSRRWSFGQRRPGDPDPFTGEIEIGFDARPAVFAGAAQYIADIQP
jgi:hypothetical protein